MSDRGCGAVHARHTPGAARLGLSQSRFTVIVLAPVAYRSDSPDASPDSAVTVGGVLVASSAMYSHHLLVGEPVYSSMR